MRVTGVTSSALGWNFGDGHPVQYYRIVDAASGLVEEGEVDVAEMISRQPWDGDLPFRVRSRGEAD